MLALFCLLFFTGCNVELPMAESGFTATTFVKLDSPNKTELSPTQIKTLTEWFAARQVGWKYKIADFYPDRVLGFRHARGKVTWIYFTGQEVFYGSYARTLTRAERAAIEDIIH